MNSTSIHTVPQNRSNRERIIWLLAIVLSILVHLMFIWSGEWLNIWKVTINPPEEKTGEEVTVLFPENKPEPIKRKEIVENINPTNEKPEQSDYLSDFNSKAKNPSLSDKIGNQPLSRGNTPFANLSRAERVPTQSQPFTMKKFSVKELTNGESTAQYSRSESQKEMPQMQTASDGSGQMLEQKDFSVSDVGPLTLSTYKWEYAPYINEMKKKLMRVWFAPPAYYQLGLISGQTILQFSVDRSGNLIDLKILRHIGHKSLEISSENAIRALFPFKPLPKDCPDPYLVITATLVYPDLRQRR